MTAKLLNLTCSPYSSSKPLLFPKYLFTYYGLFCFVLLTEGCGIVYLLLTVYVYRVSKKRVTTYFFPTKPHSTHTTPFLSEYVFSAFSVVITWFTCRMLFIFHLWYSFVKKKNIIKDSLFYNIFAVFFALK